MEYAVIYLLDDNETTNFYNLDVLSDYGSGAEVKAFSHPSEFIASYMSGSGASEKPSLLLLDINMPEKMGFEVVLELEESVDDLSSLDIVLVTSSNLKVDHEKATRFPNIIGFIEKPLTVEKLGKALSQKA